MIPEALLLVESGIEIYGKPSGEIARAAEILLSLRRRRPPDSFVTELALQVGKREGAWYKLFDRGLDAAKPDPIPSVSERSLREAVRYLSPFEKGGLGTYDFLDNIDTIDELFLFCSQALFYSERGIFNSPHSEPEAPLTPPAP